MSGAGGVAGADGLPPEGAGGALGGNLPWLRSRYGGGAQVAVLAGGGIAVRNARTPNGPVLRFTQADVDALCRGVVAGDFAPLLTGHPRRAVPVAVGLDNAPAAPLAEPAVLSHAERRLLGLLGQGMKDETVAYHLGTSVRTVRRRIAGLMERLNVRSRFQAGVAAAQKEWL